MSEEEKKEIEEVSMKAIALSGCLTDALINNGDVLSKRYPRETFMIGVSLFVVNCMGALANIGAAKKESLYKEFYQYINEVEKINSDSK